jgi:phage head maturation protease
MERKYERKYFDLKALDVDKKTKQVKVAIAELESVDRDGDVFDPSAFDVSIKQRGPQGTNEIWHLLDHTRDSFSALSKFSEIGREGKYIAGVSHYKNSFAWREVAWPLYEAGDFTQHSVGFQTSKQQKSQDGSHNVITEAHLFEGSAVLWGANPHTPTMAVVKSLLNAEDDREITAQEKLDEIVTRLKKGKYDSEKTDLLLLELLRLQNMLEVEPLHKIITNELQEKSSEPEPSSVDPDAAKFSSVIMLLELNNKNLNIII